MPDFFFNYFKYIVLLAATLVALISFVVYRNNFSAIYNSKILFVFVFLFFLYWIPQGFDITDEGYMLSKSWFMFHGLWNENLDMVWGSSFVNGLWLSLIGAPNLFWARVGFALLTASISTVVFNILQNYFEKKDSFITVFLLVILVPFGSPQTINYQNLPILFLLLAFSAYLKAENNNIKGHYVLSGIFVFMAVMMRFPLVLFLLFPALFFVFNVLQNKLKTKLYFQKTVFIYLGIFIGLIIVSALFYFTDSYHFYISAIFDRFDNAGQADTAHSIPYLFGVYVNDLRLIFIRSIFSAAFIFLIVFFFAKIKKRSFIFLLIPFFGFLLFYFALKVSVYYNWIYTILGFEASLFLIFIFFTFNKSKKYLPLIFMAACMFFVSFIASNIGFRVHIWSGTELFFGSASLLLINKVSMANKNYNFKYIRYVFFIFLFLLSIKIKSNYIYRDRPRKDLTETFEVKELRGIQSNKRKVEVTDSLLHFVKENIEEPDILVSCTMPMLYYLTGKRYVFKELWIQPETEFEEYLLNNKPPENFIFAKKNARNPYWPVRNSKILKNDSINYSYYKNYADKNAYLKVYENSMFEVYSIEK